MDLLQDVWLKLASKSDSKPTIRVNDLRHNIALSLIKHPDHCFRFVFLINNMFYEAIFKFTRKGQTLYPIRDSNWKGPLPDLANPINAKIVLVASCDSPLDIKDEERNITRKLWCVASTTHPNRNKL